MQTYWFILLIYLSWGLLRPRPPISFPLFFHRVYKIHSPNLSQYLPELIFFRDYISLYTMGHIVFTLSLPNTSTKFHIFCIIVSKWFFKGCGFKRDIQRLNGTGKRLESEQEQSSECLINRRTVLPTFYPLVQNLNFFERRAKSRFLNPLSRQ